MEFHYENLVFVECLFVCLLTCYSQRVTCSSSIRSFLFVRVLNALQSDELNFFQTVAVIVCSFVFVLFLVL